MRFQLSDVARFRLMQNRMRIGLHGNTLYFILQFTFDRLASRV